MSVEEAHAMVRLGPRACEGIKLAHLVKEEGNLLGMAWQGIAR